MTDTQQSGAYSKTGAFNFLKELLGLKKSATINKRFFELFFVEAEGFYFIKKPEDLIKNIFTENGIRELNKLYFQKKSENQKVEAQQIAEGIIAVISKSIAA